MGEKKQIVSAVGLLDQNPAIIGPDGASGPPKARPTGTRVDATHEEALAQAIAADPDDPGNDPSYWETASPVWPQRKEQVTVRLDADMLAWCRQQGRGYQIRNDAILRGHYQAHRQE